MIQIGQKIDDSIDDFEFEVYQNDEIQKTKFSNYAGSGWFCCSTDYTFIWPTELEAK